MTRGTCPQCGRILDVMLIKLDTESGYTWVCHTCRHMYAMLTQDEIKMFVHNELGGKDETMP